MSETIVNPLNITTDLPTHATSSYVEEETQEYDVVKELIKEFHNPQKL